MTEVQDLHDWNRQIIEAFRASGGNVGAPLLLLTTTGAKSGEPRTCPLVYLRDADRIYVLAGNRGAQPIPPGITIWSHTPM